MIIDINHVPIYKTENNFITDYEMQSIESFLYDYKPVNNNYFSKDTNVLDKLPRIKKLFEETLLQFKNNVIHLKQELYLTQSWIAKTPRGGYHAVHDHPNSLFSIVFYVQTPDNPINFYKQNI